MRYLKPPHIILGKGFVAGIKYPLLAERVSEHKAHQAEAIRKDGDLKLVFCEGAQALVRGDLHAGSVMVASDSTQ